MWVLIVYCHRGGLLEFGIILQCARFMVLNILHHSGDHGRISHNPASHPGCPAERWGSLDPGTPAALHVSDKKIRTIRICVCFYLALLIFQITLNVYSFENVAYHVLHQRVPLFSFRSLTKWYGQQTHLHRYHFTAFCLRVLSSTLRFLMIPVFSFRHCYM